jgi:putative exosortase-associated protein (TIGR04073 family)
MNYRRISPRRCAAACCLALLLLAPAAGADSFKTPEGSTPQEVVDGMAHKLARGIANTATGWGEFPRQIYETSKAEGLTVGILIGPLKGIGMTVVRTVTGVGEVATFFVPYPGFYEPWFEPRYVWEK